MPGRAFYASVALLVALAVGSCSSGSVFDPSLDTCEPSEVVNLSVGETAEFQGSSSRTICIGTSGESQEFVLVGVHEAQGQFLALSASADNTSIPVASPTPAPPPAMPAMAGAMAGLQFAAGPRPGFTVHDRIERRMREGFSGASLARRDNPVSAPSPAPALVVPTVGQLMTLNAQADFDCSSPISVYATVRAVSQKAIVVADRDNPVGGFSTADYERFAEIFDTLIAPLVDQYFGPVSDIDGNGRTILFFTKEVNALSEDEPGAFTAGFFYPRDLFPRTGSGQLCATSNEAEVLYLIVPDPFGVNGPSRSYDFIEQFTLGTIVHELQHLSNATARLFQPGGRFPEQSWLNEGLSHIAEELLFYLASGLSPLQNLGAGKIADAGSNAIEAFFRYQAPNADRFLRAYLDAPQSNSPYDLSVFLATRGAAWSFLRYVADRQPGTDQSFTRSLVNPSAVGLANLSSAIGGSSTLFAWLTDWAVTLYADDRVEGTAPRHQDRSWDHPSVWRFLLDGDSPYPIDTTTLIGTSPVVTIVEGGGAIYYRFAVDDGEVGKISLRDDGHSPPREFRATLMRTN